MTIRCAAQVSVCALSIILAACGGGGGTTSTPPPPTGGTPTPTPAPPPSDANDDLVGTLLSESFDNDAVTGTANYPASGSPSTSVEASSVTFEYNATSNTYTVKNGARSQSFAASDKDSGLSTDEGDVFLKTAGSTSDSLFLTLNSEEPGTRSSPQFQYVGGGVWQRTEDTATGISGSIDAFTYGVETPDASLPRTGSADYTVFLAGVTAFSDGVVSLRGEGELSVDFAGGSLTGNGTMRVGAQANQPWATSASLSSATNGFAGAFGSGAPFTSAPQDMSGRIEGRFYGPNAEELGAAWYWTDSYSGSDYAGIMIGKDNALFPENLSLRSLIVDEDFANQGWDYTLYIDSNTGQDFFGGEPNPHTADNGLPDISYSEESGALVVNSGFQFDNQPLLPEHRDPAQSDSTFDVYDFSQVDSSGKQADYWVRVFRPADDNPVIQLTYTSFLNYSWQKLDYEPYYNRHEGWAAFGQETPADAIPLTGTGNYTGVIFGQSDLAQAADGSYRSYDVTGTAQFDFDFASGGLDGFIDPTLLDGATGLSYEFDPIAFSETYFESGGQTFYGNFVGEGSFNGQFTGPAAEELFARWLTAVNDPVTGNQVDIFGVAVAERK